MSYAVSVLVNIQLNGRGRIAVALPLPKGSVFGTERRRTLSLYRTKITRQVQPPGSDVRISCVTERPWPVHGALYGGQW